MNNWVKNANVLLEQYVAIQSQERTIVRKELTRFKRKDDTKCTGQSRKANPSMASKFLATRINAWAIRANKLVGQYAGEENSSWQYSTLTMYTCCVSNNKAMYNVIKIRESVKSFS